MNGGEMFWQTINAALDIFDTAGWHPAESMKWMTVPCEQLGGDCPVDRTGDVYEFMAAVRAAAAGGVNR